MTFSDSASCERLCLMEIGKGCCFLETGIGCYWLPDGYPVKGSVGYDGISVTCYGAGRNQTIDFQNEISILFRLSRRLPFSHMFKCSF